MCLALPLVSRIQVVLLLALLSWPLLNAATASAQEAYPAVGVAPPVEPAPPVRRLVTFVPRIGGQFGLWGGELDREVEGGGASIRAVDDASGGPSLVAGGDFLFRLRSGMRLGAGVYVLPRVRLEVQFDDSELPDEERMLGTMIRVPFIIEWEIPVSHRASLMVGAVPGLVFLLRGEEEQRRERGICDGDSDCEGGDPALGPFLDGEFGALLWLDAMALRVDLRAGLEILSLASAELDGVDYTETLSGLRMQLLFGVEL